MRTIADSWFVRAIVLSLVLTSASLCAQQSEVILFGLTNSWRYNQTTSYDGVPWTAAGFDDTALPVGRGVLGLEDTGNAFVTARTNTVLALGRTTYYFRTHFNFTNIVPGLSLTFSNVVDDGAIFYLNGIEVQRLYMTNGVTATYSSFCTNHEATSFDVFTVSGPQLMTNLVSGDNVLAVEVHQTTAGSSDIVFGCALSANMTMTPPPLRMPLTPPAYCFALTNAFGTLAFVDPLALVTPPGETNRLFVVEQAGRIAVITNLAAPNRSVFLDISSRIVGGLPTDERGLLGLAFHPGYVTNGYFFVFYSVNSTTPGVGTGLHERVSRFQVSSTNVNVAATNELVLINQYDEAVNHNGGCLQFGPDGYLYVSVGDEGNQNGSLGNSQLINRDFFSAILRIDVDVPSRAGSLPANPHPSNTNNATATVNYRVPPDNPYVGAASFNGTNVSPASVRTEFYAVGFRNPWRFTFDPLTGELYCADVGQDTWEEIDLVTRGGNYGWNYREGLHARPGSPNPPAAFSAIDPIHEYQHGSGSSQGNSVSGGVVYRGNRISALTGSYIFADYVSGNVWALRANGSNFVGSTWLTRDAGIAGFGVDPRNGDVLAADQSENIIKRLILDTNTFVGSTFPQTLADTGAFTNLTSITNQTQPLTASAGMVPYDINVHFWSDNARKSRWFLASPQTRIGFNADGNHWSLPSGMSWVKHFDLEMTNGVASSARRLETRLIVRIDTGVYGVTYRWDSLTNATLVPEEGMDEVLTINDGGTVRTQVWHYPSRGECLVCHTPTGGFALGFNTAQMNRDFDYGSGASNQIAAMSAAGYFTGPVSNIYALHALAVGTNENVSREWRVRSYLAANCAQCHQPGGSALGFWNASITNSTASAGLIDGPLNNYFTNANARVIAPGSLSNSMLLTRISTRGLTQMPPLASSVLDTGAIALVSAWITNDLANGWTNTVAPLSTAVTRTNGGVAVQFNHPMNRAYRVDTATNLSPPVAWQFLNVPENRPFYPASNAPATVPDAITNTTQKFYRVRVSAP